MFNESYYSIHQVSNDIIVKSEEFGSYLEAENEFEKINKEHEIKGVRFIVSPDEDFSDLPNTKETISKAIPISEYNEQVKADQFDYMMLGRLKQDCEYFLGNGNGHEKHLWADNIQDHIKEMEKLHNAVKFKPDYLTKEDIQEYKDNMCKLRLEQEKDNPDFITKDNIADYYEFMNDDNLEKYKDILSPIFKKRAYYIVNNSFFQLPNRSVDFDDNWLTVLDIKDTLKPINEYIEEIKQSSEYKDYLKEQNMEHLKHGSFVEVTHNREEELISSYSKADKNHILENIGAYATRAIKKLQS